MRRYYSHFTFIYPDIYLKNHVVELDSENRIVKCFPFEKEIEKTEFYSGWLFFIDKEENILINISNLKKFKEMFVCLSLMADKVHSFRNKFYNIYDEDGAKIS